VKCLTKAYDGPHQTTIILSTPFMSVNIQLLVRLMCFPEVVILVNQSTKDVKDAYVSLSIVLVLLLIFKSASTITNG